MPGWIPGHFASQEQHPALTLHERSRWCRPLDLESTPRKHYAPSPVSCAHLSTVGAFSPARQQFLEGRITLAYEKRTEQSPTSLQRPYVPLSIPRTAAAKVTAPGCAVAAAAEWRGSRWLYFLTSWRESSTHFCWCFPAWRADYPAPDACWQGL